MIMSYHVQLWSIFPLPNVNICRKLANSLRFSGRNFWGFQTPMAAMTPCCDVEGQIWGSAQFLQILEIHSCNFHLLSAPNGTKTSKILIALIVVLLLVNSTKSFCFLNSNMCGSLNTFNSKETQQQEQCAITSGNPVIILQQEPTFTIPHRLFPFMSIHVVPLQGCCSSTHIDS